MSTGSRKLLPNAIAVAAGAFLIYYSVRPVMGFVQVYYYWSFTYIAPLSRLNLTPGLAYNLPAIVSTYEVLLPWLIAGTALIAIAVILLYRNLKKDLYNSASTGGQ